MTGGVLSTLFTVKLHVAVLPAASVAVSFTICVAITDSDVPATGYCVIIIDPDAVQLSLAVARLI